MGDIMYPGFQHQRIEKWREKGIEESKYPLSPSATIQDTSYKQGKEENW